MGLFHVGCKVENHRDGKSAVIPRLTVDTGSEFTWIDGRVLEKLGVERRKKDLQIQMANRQITGSRFRRAPASNKMWNYRGLNKRGAQPTFGPDAFEYFNSAVTTRWRS